MQPDIDSSHPGIGTGIYTPAEAAALLHEDRETVHRWAFGYGRLRRGGRREHPALIRTEQPVLEGMRSLSFVELVELMYVRGFVRAGVPWPQIKKAAEVAARLYRTTHPFALRSFFADPHGVYAAIREQDGAESLVALVGHGQHTFAELVRPYLGHLDFDTDDVATRWWPLGREGRVVVDPRFAFGAPVLEEVGIRADVLSTAYDAELEQHGDGAPDRVAWLYSVRPEQVRSALRFREWLRAA